MVERVCLVSSGSGGHLLPALILARALRGAGKDAVLLTAGRPVEDDLLARFDCRGTALPMRGGRIGLPLSLAQATVRARRFLREQRVDLVVGTGGRTSVPACLAARSLGLPVCLMEQNVVPGRANRLLTPLARRVYYGLPPRRAARQGLVTGTPLRAELWNPDRAAARRSLGLPVDGLIVLVTGGSQGARALNEIAPPALARCGQRLHVLHLAGNDDTESVRLRYALDPERVVALVRGVVRDIAPFYGAADLVICRGGGGTVAELAAAGRAALIVPYPWHRDRQQYHNGRVLADGGAAVVLEQSDLTIERLAREVAALVQPGRLAEMGARARALAAPDACARILADLEQL
jgi:UDP-N-acetylglucosamine--N-acetylmuramyl-(pentapeptide) pyrophosphoryl-undecaprenol N-acetylglucosamine transferase